jgi:hypothetical protein
MATFTCDVKHAGANKDGKIHIVLNDQGGAFGDTFFVAPTVAANQMLATALAAISTGFPVHADLDSTNDGSTIGKLVVVRQ